MIKVQIDALIPIEAFEAMKTKQAFYAAGGYGYPSCTRDLTLAVADVGRMVSCMSRESSLHFTRVMKESIINAESKEEFKERYELLLKGTIYDEVAMLIVRCASFAGSSIPRSKIPFDWQLEIMAGSHNDLIDKSYDLFADVAVITKGMPYSHLTALGSILIQEFSYGLKHYPNFSFNTGNCPIRVKRYALSLYCKLVRVLEVLLSESQLSLTELMQLKMRHICLVSAKNIVNP